MPRTDSGAGATLDGGSVPFQTLFEQSPFSTQIFSPDGQTLRVNRAWEALWGVTLDQIADYNILNDPQLVDAGLMPYIERGFAGEPTAIPAILYDPNRTLPDRSRHAEPARWVRAFIYPVRGPAGVIDHIVLVHEEVSEQKRAEQEAATALAAQLALRDRLSALAEASAALLASLAPEDVFPAVGVVAQRLIPADAYAVWRFDRSAGGWGVRWRQHLSDRIASEIDRWPEPRAIESALAAPWFVADIATEDRLAHRQPLYAEEGIRALLVIPLRTHGELRGTVVAYYREPMEFTEAQRHLATAFSNLASTALTAADLYELQRASRAAAEEAERRAVFLARSGSILASSLDYAQTLSAIAQLAVPHIADWCAVDIVTEEGTMQRLAVAHVDPTKVQLAHTLRERYPEDPESPYGVHQVLRTTRSVLMPRIPNAVLVASARDAQHLELLRELGLTSYMCVPLLVQGRAVGVLTFVAAESGREYGDADLRFAEDVAARAAMAVGNARAHEDVRRANQLKDDFLATLSHELRTPLNAILGYTRMLRSGAVPPERQARALEIAERNAVALNKLVEDVLDVSRIVSGKIRLQVQTVDLSAVLLDAVASVSPAADAKGIRVHSVLDPAAAPVAGDPERLQQVVWNLLSNAVKFTPRGGRVQVRLERVNSHVEIVVSDTGIGVSPEFLPHMFERFRQADARFAREHGGLGLGLAISRHLVEMHGGLITAASEGEGLGTTFRVKLPSLIVHREPQLEPVRVHPRADRPEAALPLPSVAGLHVLAVDDEPDARTLLAEVLEAAGARVTLAASADEALAFLRAEHPDVVVTDIGMPGMDGYALVSQLRASTDRSTRALPVAALTAYARSEDRIRALQSGFQMHLAKPINPAELVAAVRALASRRQDPSEEGPN